MYNVRKSNFLKEEIGIMRYYELTLPVNSEQIKERAVIRLTNYHHESAIGAVNSYMEKNSKNGLMFFTYREEDDGIRAVFTYDEKARSFSDAYEHIVCILNDVFGVSEVLPEPGEITMRSFFDRYIEAKRRDILWNFTYYRFTLGDWFLDLFNFGHDKNYSGKAKFSFDECLVPELAPEMHTIFDAGFVKELMNIESHASDRTEGINVVHYSISARSKEASLEMATTLANRLFNAGRISGKRIGMIGDIDPMVYKDNYIEEIIENSSGGIVVFDLRSKFGCGTSEYVMAAKFIADLFKRYRNQCLFVFSYDINEPGFAYQILPIIRNSAIIVSVREGSGDRLSAEDYLSSLIRGSELSEYACQAGEFLKDFGGDTFSQTDVIEAFEKFEPWCINKNILNAYDKDASEDYMLDRDENAGSHYDRLQKLIGLNAVKRQIDELLASSIVSRERKRRSGTDHGPGTLHMVFSGNPGTAKTTVARLFAGIGKEKGLLKSGVFVECGGMDLNGSPDIIHSKFIAAKGGVLFIDEAYGLFSFGSITTLVQEIENHRDDVVVILAGYSDAMKAFLRQNEGLKSRIPNWIDFPDYSTDELTEIFRFIVESMGFRASEDAVKEARYILQKARMTDDFGNGRYVRNLVERAVKHQSMRLYEIKKDVKKIRKKELFLITKEDVLSSEETSETAKREKGSAMRELDEMIGLKSVKAVIHRAIAHYKMNKLCMNRGINRDNASLHMVFTGNPGTAKTTVARLFAEILRDEMVLPTGKFIEVGRAELVGQFVGSTAIIVKNKFREAKGGVLFIDEAYALCDGYEKGFGNEAIDEINREIENNREDTIVIFAGYPEPMSEFIARNPGMRSRIAFHVQFDDYSVDELCEITRLMADRKGLNLTEAVMDKFREIYEQVEKEGDFGNGRFVRKLLEEAEMNQSVRLLELDEAALTDELITSIEEQDVPEARHGEDTETKCYKRRIGFD